MRRTRARSLVFSRMVWATVSPRSAAARPSPSIGGYTILDNRDYCGSAHSHVLAPVDVDLGAMDVGRGLGAQHVDDLGDLVGGTQPVEWNLLDHVLSAGRQC